jgi:serine/threonine protein kinase
MIDTIICKKYKIDKLLGHGKFGTVYKGINIKNTQLGCQLLLHLMLKSLTHLGLSQIL